MIGGWVGKLTLIVAGGEELVLLWGKMQLTMEGMLIFVGLMVMGMRFRL
jgi:hypothetical protein